jgi:deoxycytidine triphosphate deaminase
MPETEGQYSLTSPIRQDIQYWPRGLTTIFGRNQSGPDWSFALPNAITGDRLCKAIEDQTFIKNGALKCAEGIKYDFRMGSHILKAKFGRSMDMSRMSEEQKAEMVVNPGEVVFVLTEEVLDLPDNIMAQLMPKRKLSHDGILVLGGFCVDPLYKGKLLVGLYNFSSATFVLDPGRKLIAAVFFELQESERGAFKKPETEVVDFPQDLVRLISSYQPIDITTLRDNIGSLEIQIGNLRNEITTDKEWKRDFQSKLERQGENIDKLLKGLEEEKDNRLAAEKSISEQISNLKVGQGQAITQGATSHTLQVALISIVITFILTVGITILAVWLAIRGAR